MKSSLRLCAFAGTILLCATLAAQPLRAQTSNAPEREQLLNGLRLLFWLKPGSPDVILKLRINSGAAFDLSGKSGQMALLGDLLFPDPATVDYFSDEMGGKLDVSVTYDSTTITMVGKADQLEHIVEVLRNALIATQFTPEVVTKMRDARIKLVRDTIVSRLRKWLTARSLQGSTAIFRTGVLPPARPRTWRESNALM